MWVLSKDFKTPPTRLGVKCYEGPAVSRTSLKIAWTQVHEQYPDLISSGEGRICMAEIVYKDGVPSLQDTKVILDNPKSRYKYSKIETQNFIPPHENELTFQCYSPNGTESLTRNINSANFYN